MKKTVFCVIITAIALSVMAGDYISIEGEPFYEVPRDTTRYYISEIKTREHCDTIAFPIACPDTSYAYQDGCLVSHYARRIRCDDTLWLKKIQVWLTPVQIEKLMEVVK